MTPATSMQGPRRPGSRIRHSWRCTRRGRIGETTRPDPDGNPIIVAVCLECDGTDYDARLADRLLPGDGPDAA